MENKQAFVTKTLDDVARIYSGGTPASTNPLFWGGDIPWLSSGETSNPFITKTEKRITNAGVENSSTRKAFANSTVIASAGQGHTRGQTSFLKIDTYVNQSLIVLEPKTCIEPLFLYYNLRNRYEELRQLSDGTSTRGGLSGWIVKKMSISLPPLETQRKISSVLGAIDDKIELNNRMNERLEEQATLIFDNEIVNSSHACDSWKKEPLDSVAEYLNGLAMQKYAPNDVDDSLPVLKIAELKQGFCGPDSNRCHTRIPPQYIIKDGDVIFSWSASLVVDFWCGGIAGLNQHLFKVTSKRFDKWFYYSWTKYYLEDFIQEAAAKATTMGHITRDRLTNAIVTIPDNKTYLRVGGLLTPIYEQIIANRIENKRLAELRDALLPKLMSGEIDVDKVEI